MTVEILDNNSASGRVIAQFVLAASAVGTPHWFGPQGINCGAGVYVKVTGTGTPAGSVFVG